MGDFDSIQLPGAQRLDDHARYDRATFAFETKDYRRAAELLADPDAACARFTKVLPRQFAAVSAALAKAADEGLDAGSPDVWNTILEASHG